MTPGARAFVFSMLIMAIVTGGLIINLVNQGKLIELSKTNRTLNRDSTDLLRIVVATTGCKVTDTPKQCRNRVEKTSKVEGETRIKVLTCIIHEIKNGASEAAANEECFKPPPKEAP